MSERYSKLFALSENLYTNGSPVVIAAGALLKDNQTGKVIAQLKLRNIGNKIIKAATVSIMPFDTVGNPLGESVQYQYLDLNAQRDNDFGSKSAISLPDITTRSFAATVTEIAFVDNTVWTATTDPWEPLSVPVSLSSFHGTEFAKQFCLEYGTGCKNFPLSEKDLWHCACGALNHKEESHCHSCRKSYATISSFNVDELNEKKNKRVAEEKVKQEYDAEQAKIKAAANAKKIKIFAIIAAAIILVCTIISSIQPHIKVVRLNTTPGSNAVVSSIPLYNDYLQIDFKLKGSFSGTMDLTHRITYADGEVRTSSWRWDDVESGETCGIEWDNGFHSYEKGTVKMEIINAKTNKVIGTIKFKIK